MTDEGYCALAGAVGEGPWLEHLESLRLGPLCYITNVGMGCMVSAVIDRCPRLKSLHLGTSNHYWAIDARRLVEGMLRGAGRD